MSKKGSGKRKGKEKKALTPKEKLKMEIAAELGLLERVEQDGWDSLTLAECGRVGGLLARRMKELNIEEEWSNFSAFPPGRRFAFMKGRGYYTADIINQISPNSSSARGIM